MPTTSITQPVRIHEFVLCLIASCLVAGCQKNTEPHRPAEAGLRVQDAALRSEQLDNISYALGLRLDGESESYAGHVRVEFDLLRRRAPVTVDFSGGSISAMRVNGRPREPHYNGLFITFPATLLEAGRNVIEIEFSHPYGNNGIGLDRFRDPEDGRVYLHSYLWPYYANRLFPCFDQPDLKAIFTLEVEAPAHWQVISSAAEATVEDRGAKRLWRFPETPRLSTYVFSLHAGPYHAWEGRAGDVDLRLFARHSVAADVPAEEWLEVTASGLEFYEQYFGIAYPWEKYDQIIVPEAAITAMENVAAVTFSETRLLPGAPLSSRQREFLANTVLHELAHMWFGNLVTMEWWNGLWLNEGFATYMAPLAMAEVTPFTGAWHTFYLDDELGAYRKDRSVLTHPVDVPVASTREFFSIFDAITYGKGAAALKQLSHRLGAAVFRRGVQVYLERHAFGNATLAGFIDAVAAASGEDLQNWSREWLHIAGLDQVRVRYQCEGGKVDAFEVRQAPLSGESKPRTQRVQLAALRTRENSDELVLDVLPVMLTGERTTVARWLGVDCPDLVYPNYGDWGYMLVLLDPTTQAALGKWLADVPDPLLRSMFWQALWHQAQEAELGLDAYLDLLREQLHAETDRGVVTGALETFDEVMLLYWRMAPAPERLVVLEEWLWGQATRQSSAAEMSRVWLERYVATASSTAALQRLSDALETGSPALLATDLRDSALVALSAHAYPDAEALVEREADESNANRARRLRIAATAARPDAASKAKWLRAIREGEEGYSPAELLVAVRNLFPPQQTALRATFADELLELLPHVSARHDQYFVNIYSLYLLPELCREDNVARLARMLEGSAELQVPARNALVRAHENELRCVAMRMAPVNARSFDAGGDADTAHSNRGAL